jgi:hypothetical protein
MRKLIALALVAGCTGLLADGNSASTSATASVNLYAPIVLHKGSDVNFGVFVFDGSAVKLSMTNAGVVTGGTKFSGSQLDASFTLAKAGAFDWTKDPNLTVNVKVNDTVLTGATTTLLPAVQLGDPKVMWTIKADMVSLAASGTLAIYGDLDIVAGATAKSYQGTFTVTVAYN